MNVELSTGATGILMPAAVALVILSSLLLCVCANRKRKAIRLRSDIPVEINGIQTISRKIQGSYDSDQFRTAAIDSSTGSVYPSRRLPERPVSICDPSSTGSSTPVPSVFSPPSTSHSAIHRQLADVSANNDLRSSKERKVADVLPSGGHDTAASSDVDRIREIEDDDELDDRPYAKVKITTKKMRKKPRDDHPYAKIQDYQEAPVLESDSDNDRAPLEDAHPPRVISPQQRVTSGHLTSPDGVVPSTSRIAPGLEPVSFSPPASNLRQDVADGAGVVQHSSLPVAENSHPQTHFSGDSQDSRGYTSISVREPLAHIRAQMGVTAGAPQTMVHESPYASVIEDSDEMYAAIDSGGGSETYAQIELPPLNEESSYPPVPPSVRSLRSAVSQARCRISSPPALGLSLNAGGADVVDSGLVGRHGAENSEQHSPKPERRVLNSPLPPTPTPPVERREDVYAKVTGKTRPSHSMAIPPSSAVPVASASRGMPSPRAHKRIKSETIAMSPFPSYGASPSTSMSNVSSRPHHEVNYSDFEVVRDGMVPSRRSAAIGTSASESDLDPTYETIGKQVPLPAPPGGRMVVPSGDVYAQIQVSQKRAKLPALPVDRQSSPEPSDTYATLNNDDPIGEGDDPNYERLAGDYERAKDFGYEKVRSDALEEDDDGGSPRGRDYDADYESLGYNRIRREFGAAGGGSEPEPGYEEIREKLVSNDVSDDDGNYERVGATEEAAEARGDDQELYDDGYEQLHPKEEGGAGRGRTPARPSSDVYAVVDTRAKAHHAASNSSKSRPGDEKVLCRLVDLPPVAVERARKVVQVARSHLRDESGPATNMTVVTINDDEISIRNHLKEELPPHRAASGGNYARATNGPVQLVVHSPGIFEDVTVQL